MFGSHDMSGVGKWPVDFTRRMQFWLGEQATEFFISMEKHDVGLRLNPTRDSLPALKAVLPWMITPVPWCPEGLKNPPNILNTGTAGMTGVSIWEGRFIYQTCMMPATEPFSELRRCRERPSAPRLSPAPPGGASGPPPYPRPAETPAI